MGSLGFSLTQMNEVSIITQTLKACTLRNDEKASSRNHNTTKDRVGRRREIEQL